ncbi:MAG: hypothetical protein ACOYW7_08860 [Nitrospirota bacterium]
MTAALVPHASKHQKIRFSRGVNIDHFAKKSSSSDTVQSYKSIKTTADYEKAGQWWRASHWNNKFTFSSPIDNAFIEVLINPNNLDFFWVHTGDYGYK